MIKYKASIPIFLLILLLCNVVTLPLRANEHIKASLSEDIIIAFYKTGKAVPNFGKWIKTQELYLKTPWALQDKVYDKEIKRLKKKYIEFAPQKDLLVVITKSDFKLSQVSNDEGETKYYFKSKFSNAPEALYFPFDYLNERIVLMPYNLEKFLNHEITQGDYNYIHQEKFNKQGVTTILRMSAYESDLSQPYKIDGLEQWVLKTKIATIEYWSDGRLIYEYSTPAYLSPNTQHLQNLFKDRPTNSKIQKGVVKPVPSFDNKE